MFFKVNLYKNRNSVDGGHKEHYSRRSLRDIKVVERTHTQMERRREWQGGGVGKEPEVACNKQMER